MNSDEPKSCSTCTIGLLTMACQAAYMLQENDRVDQGAEALREQTFINIAQHGYAITRSVLPGENGGTGKTPLAAVCLEPLNSVNPIVISFRGTDSVGDVLSDARLGTLGVVETGFRNAAFAFYKTIRERNPDREIILTGHSLGGHIAQYVATKAYNTDTNLQSRALLHVRTFNTAPINTKHSAIFEYNPELLTHFVNYRLASDAVSDLPLQQYYGKTFVFPCDKGILDSHPLETIIQYLPKAVQAQTVGSSSESDALHNQLIEFIQGNSHSYQCRVEAQFFSRYRAGARNLEAMKTYLPEILESVKIMDYDKAIPKLKALHNNLDGKVSSGMIVDLLADTECAVKKQRINSWWNMIQKEHDDPSDSSASAKPV